MQKRWSKIKTDEVAASVLQEELDIHPVLCRLLVQRNIRDKDAAHRFFYPQLSDLHDPFLLRDMASAVHRLNEAIFHGESILLYGDYDVDGTTAVAMMYSFLQGRHGKLDYYLPDRYREGYGISIEGIDYAHKEGITLIIAMDCGIKAIDQVEYARSLGIDVIICDHHLPDGILPQAVAVLNPKRKDCSYPFKELSGCGVAFKLIQAYAQEEGFGWEVLESLLDFLVISIAGDLVPIVDENRILAHYGLAQLNRTPRPGLRVLIDRSGRNRPLTINDIIFGLAPTINAAGRMGDARQAVRLLLEGRWQTALEKARQLSSRNRLRQNFDRTIAAEAEELLKNDAHLDGRRSIVLYRAHWHKGVLGIVASRISSSFDRPTIILTQNSGLLAGSVRSAGGCNVYEALGNCRDFLVDFGGHKFAAGLSMKPEHLETFRECFEIAVQKQLSRESAVPLLPYCEKLALADITPEFRRVLCQFAPFGPENDHPVFVAKGVRDAGNSRVLKGGHLRLRIRQGHVALGGIALGRAGDLQRVASREPFDICYSIRENQYNGARRVQLMVEDMRFRDS